MEAWAVVCLPLQLSKRMNRNAAVVLGMKGALSKLADGGDKRGNGSVADLTCFVKTESERYSAIVKAGNNNQ